MKTLRYNKQQPMTVEKVPFEIKVFDVKLKHALFHEAVMRDTEIFYEAVKVVAGVSTQ